MIHLVFNDIHAESLIQFAIKTHKETRFGNDELNIQSFCNFFDTICNNPDRFFMSYYTIEDKVIGMFFGQLSPEYFSGKFIASDLGMFVDPEYRGNGAFIRMYKAFEQWAKDKGAYKIVLYHSTGIESEKTKKLFTKLNYNEYGSIFDKEL